MREKLINDTVIRSYKPSIKSINSYFDYLKKTYGFNDSREKIFSNKHKIQDVFDIAIRPILQYSVSKLDVNLYSAIDHYLFSAYICPFEDVVWFDQAFWNVNYYGSALADQLNKGSSAPFACNGDNRSLLIIFKGPFLLAHSEVLQDFLEGCSRIDNSPQIYVLFLDAKNSDKFPANIKFISFAQYSTEQKIYLYLELTSKISFYNIVWVACVQNLMLYMGLRRSALQTYWTMKRHSIVHPKIDKYATVVSAYRNTSFNQAYWFGGRYRLKTNYSKKSKDEILSALNQSVSSRLQESSKIIGSFARPQKYLSLEYWQGIEWLLSECSSLFFIYGTSALPTIIQQHIQNSSLLRDRSHNFGWLKGKTAELCSLVDIYVDNIPFASGMTASQCVWAGGVYLGTYTDLNKESSFINVLCDAYLFKFKKSLHGNQQILSSLGISSDFSEALCLAKLVAEKEDIAKKIHNNQIHLLKSMDKIGQQFFSKDYLNFFLDTKIS